MTHEYVIALAGRIDTGAPDRGEAAATAVAWAADHVLAVGTDAAVRSISRGDSTFLDLGGCVVTACPWDVAQADALIGKAIQASDENLDVGALLIDAGLLDAEEVLQLGSPADLAFWEVAREAADTDAQLASRLVALVRGGAFTEGDEHFGPFPSASDTA